MRPEYAYQLLDEPLIGFQRRDGTRAHASLPGILAGLGSGEVEEFTAIRPHQFHAWHAFLVQLATLVARSEGPSVAPDSETSRRSAEAWRAALVRLTGGRPEPWALVVEALDSPAFMQPPVPEGSLAQFKNVHVTPDSLDVLLTAKNHDLKRQRMRFPSAEHWVYALVALQTTEGYGGKNNYGIARMNGGSSSRPGFAVAPSDSWSSRFGRDTVVWLESYPELIKAHGYAPDGFGLLWLEPWDGESSIPLRSCQPAFIEVCRRVRLTQITSGIAASTAGSKVARLDTHNVAGVTGDIWTPVSKSEAKSLTPTRMTLRYRKLSDHLLSEDFEPGDSAVLRTEDGESPVFIGRTFARGNCKSDGMYERVVPIPAKARRFFGRHADRASLGAAANQRIEQAKQVERRLLKPALVALAQGGAEKLRLDDDRVGVWLRDFDSRLDARFFGMLFDSVDQPPADAMTSWTSFLVNAARSVLTEAERSIPIPSIRRPRAVATAWRLLEGGARKHFPDLFAETSRSNG